MEELWGSGHGGLCGAVVKLKQFVHMKRLFVSVTHRALIRDLFVAQLNLHEFLGE